MGIFGNQKRTNGFTIVELIVIISLIGILVTISIVGWGAWRKSVAEKEVKSDLNGVMAGMESAKNFSAGYPLTPVFTGTNVVFSQSADVLITYVSGSATEYCVNASSRTVTSVQYYLLVRGVNKTIQSGTCADAPFVWTIASTPAPTIYSSCSSTCSTVLSGSLSTSDTSITSEEEKIVYLSTSCSTLSGPECLNYTITITADPPFQVARIGSSTWSSSITFTSSLADGSARSDSFRVRANNGTATSARVYISAFTISDPTIQRTSTNSIIFSR